MIIFQRRQNDTAFAVLPVLFVMSVTLSLACVYVCADGGDAMVWNGKSWVPQKPPKRGTPQGDLNHIRELMGSGQYKKAVKEVDIFLVNYSGNPACEEAMNLAGQARMDQGEYWAAYQRFEDQIAAYPNGAFFDRALDREYKIADAFLQGRKRRALKILKLSAKDEGLDILMRISGHSPNSELGQKSLLRVADYYFNNRDYRDAISAYEDFEKQYPKSPRRAYAMLQTAKAYVNSYKGIKWDDTPLIDAKKKYEIFAAAYPRMAKREDVSGILKQIHDIRAHKVYNTAEFYRRVERPEAAVFYYRKTVEEFPGTQWADTAKEMLDILSPNLTPEQRRAAETGPVIQNQPKRKYGIIDQPPTITSDSDKNKPAATDAERSARDVIVPIDKLDFEFPTLSNAEKKKPQPQTQPAPVKTPERLPSYGEANKMTPEEVKTQSEINTQPAEDKTQPADSPIRLDDLRRRLKTNQ